MEDRHLLVVIIWPGIAVTYGQYRTRRYLRHARGHHASVGKNFNYPFVEKTLLFKIAFGTFAGFDNDALIVAQIFYKFSKVVDHHRKYISFNF